MRTADQMLDFVRGKTPERFAACPVFTDVFTQGLHGHDWLLTSNDPRTIDEICNVGRDCGFVPFFETLWFEVDVIDFDEMRIEGHGDHRDHIRIIRTPQGEFTHIDRFTRRLSRHAAQHAFSKPQDIHALMHIVERSLDRIERCRPRLREVIAHTAGRGVPYFTCTMPHRCFSLISSEDLVYWLMDEPDLMLRVAELNEKLTRAAMRIAAEEGFRAFFAGTESGLYSPRIIARYCTPLLLERRKLIRELGGVLYFHECGGMRRLIDDTTYARVNPEVLEGFQPPPSGDITSLGEAVGKLPKSIVTKGNFDLNFLKTASKSQVKEASIKLLESLPGRRHLLGGACSALPGTPLDNFRAMVEAADEVNRRERPSA